MEVDEDSKKNQQVLGDSPSSFSSPVAVVETSVKNEGRSTWRRIISFIDIEPAYFLHCVAYSCIVIIVTDFLFYQTCRANLDYSEEYCKSNKTSDDDVAREVADIKIWSEVLEGVFTVILFLYIGAWSDSYGRKFPMLLAISGYIIQSVALLITNFFPATPGYAVILISLLPISLTGQVHSVMWAIASYIADTTSVKDRTLKLGIMSCMFAVGNSVGAALAGVLKGNDVDYVAVFGTGAGIQCLAFIYIFFFIKNTGKKGEKQHLAPNSASIEPKENSNPDPDSAPAMDSEPVALLSLRHTWRTAKTFFKKREGSGRLQLMLLVLTYICNSIAFSGERVVLQQFAYKHIGWTTSEYAYFKTVQNIIPTIGEMLALAILVKFLKLHDSSLGIVACLSQIGGSLVFAFADRTWMMYLAPVVSIFNGPLWTTTRSSISKVVPASEIGKVNSFVGLFSNVSPLVTDPMYAAIFRYTLDSFPGTFFFVSVFVTIPPIFIFMYLYRASHRNSNPNPEKAETDKA